MSEEDIRKIKVIAHDKNIESTVLAKIKHIQRKNSQLVFDRIESEGPCETIVHIKHTHTHTHTNMMY